jgi:hypothetical protein
VEITPPGPSEAMAVAPSASARELATELIRRLDLLDTEGETLRTENERLTQLVHRLNLPAWRVEETRVGTSRLVPGPRAFIRRRRR